MALFNSFTFDGENSLDSGIYITGEAVFNSPVRSVEMITVPGRNGAIVLDRGRFENIAIRYPAGCFADSMSEFAEKIATFRNILASRVGYKRIVDTYHPDEFRMGVYTAGLEVSAKRYNSAGEFDIEFDCKPQRWLLSGETTTTYSADGTITNPTEFDARPLLKITGAGTLTLGSQTMTIAEGSSPTTQEIYVDCETQEAWEIVGAGKLSRNDYIQNAGESFPVLSGGSNAIILGSGISEVEITPRWWRI